MLHASLTDITTNKAASTLGNEMHETAKVGNEVHLHFVSYGFVCCPHLETGND
jgi:hypothetical protein